MIRPWTFELGEYHNNLKCGKWIQIVNNYQMGGGLFNEEGLKNGTWIEMIDNCDIEWRNVGNYQNGKKIGQWNTKITKDVNISGGYYDKNGIKDGWWIDLIDRWIINDDVITCQGFYRNGKKFGNWNTIARNFIYKTKGYYNFNGMKEGKWIELVDNFSYWNQISSQGQYKNDKKIGIWDTISQKNQVIGSGIYNYGQKVGYWIEINDDFIQNLITYHGVYKSGKKFGRWEIKKEGKQINWGGFYDENGFKVGDWFENLENLKESCEELNDHGAYKKGIKQGRWNIILEKNQIIGGGVYDENGFKNGKWIQLHENWEFNLDITENGEYLNGLKCGVWQTIFTKYKNQEIIGCGAYDENGFKHEKWIELHKNWREFLIQLYLSSNQVTYNGEYQHGLKSGKWEIILKQKKIQTLGGGLYDENGMKVGKWIDISDAWDSSIGAWNILFDPKKTKIGGGSYDQNGMKNGHWVDLCETFWSGNQITLRGEYKNWKKIGEWNMMSQRKKFRRNLYDEDGMTSDNWTPIGK